MKLGRILARAYAMKVRPRGYCRVTAFEEMSRELQSLVGPRRRGQHDEALACGQALRQARHVVWDALPMCSCCRRQG